MNTPDTRTRLDSGSAHPGAEPDPAETTTIEPDDTGPVRLDELAIPALLVMIGGYLAYGLATMEVPATADWPGPGFFPTIITVIIFVIAALLSVQIVLAHRRTRTSGRDGEPRTDWKATGTVVAALLVFAAALLPLGWILAGTLLFWGVARGLGSRRPGFDLLVALGMSCLIQLAFSAGLGLRLPPGILGWF